MIGGLENDVRRLAADEDVDIANINSPNQIVISGELANVETSVGVAKEYGIGRAMMLNVAGAYHSRLMSVSTLMIFKGAATPSSVVNLSIVRTSRLN